MSVARNLYYALPPVARRFTRRLLYLPVDAAESLLGIRDPMIPPRGRIFIGSGDFIKTGDSIRDQLVEMAGLQTYHRILDVGCGIGRVAVPLTGFLDNRGSYEGFDIVKPAIRWCRERISSRFPHFRFTHIDLKNDLYNKGTKVLARDFVFPYRDEDFDLVFLASVFTHMLPEDVINYLDQIHRVLKPGGICFATFFIMNREAQNHMDRSGNFVFGTRLEHHYLFHARVKEANVAYDEQYLMEGMIGSAGFIIEQVHYGFWSGRPKTPIRNFQDICVFRKT